MNTNLTPSEDRIDEVLATIGLIDEDGNVTDKALYDALYAVMEDEPIEVDVYYEPEEKGSGEWGYSLGSPSYSASAEVEGATWFGQEIKLTKSEEEEVVEKVLSKEDDYGDY